MYRILATMTEIGLPISSSNSATNVNFTTDISHQRFDRNGWARFLNHCKGPSQAKQEVGFSNVMMQLSMRSESICASAAKVWKLPTI